MTLLPRLLLGSFVTAAEDAPRHEIVDAFLYQLHIRLRLLCFLRENTEGIVGDDVVLHGFSFGWRTWILQQSWKSGTWAGACGRCAWPTARRTGRGARISPSRAC